MASNGNLRRTFSRRGVWLTTVSAVAMLLLPAAGQARSLNGAGSEVQSAPNVAADAASQAAQQAAAAARQTGDSLARAARAVQEMQAAQAAARAAAAVAQASAVVPNGLGVGGLLPNVSAGWSGAKTPTQSVDADGRTQVGIEQTSQRAILNWQSFNVGARTTLTFDQKGNANWVALNRVDSATAPSLILGNIRADGQVYVINQSGIIFGGGSQVNVGALIASAAGITDSQFLTKGIFSSQSGGAYAPSFTASGGKVVLETGATISTHAPASVTSGGGFVLLIGSEVANAGMIGTPNGQALLAAGDSFILRPGFGTDSNVTSTTRGIEIAPVIAQGGTAGGVVNSGLIVAQQGDITLTGRTITQAGALVSTTSVNSRGTIHLLNSASDDTGTVTLAGGSLSAILPELVSTDTALDAQRDALIAASAANLARPSGATGVFDNLSSLADRQDQSRIEIVTGGTINFKNGSYTAAQGGQIAASAGKRIFVEDGAALDVSGVRHVAVAMASNNIKVNVQGNELRDSPQNRDSEVLKNNDVWIDIRDLTLVPAGTGGYASDRYYTAGGLLEVGGYLGTTAHSIGEWSALGGSITLASAEVITQRGSLVDISGGSLDYAAGWIRSTNLIGSDGRSYSIDQAPSDLTFTSFGGSFSRRHSIQGKTDNRLTEIWGSVSGRGRDSYRWEEGYSVGRDAGRLTVFSPTVLLDGDIVADTIVGDRQVSKRSAGVADGYKAAQTTVAQAGGLVIGRSNGIDEDGAFGTPIVLAQVGPTTSELTADASLSTQATNQIQLDAARLSSFGLGLLRLTSSSSITVAAPLTLADGGSLQLIAPDVGINANVTARSGSVSIGNVAPVSKSASSAATPLFVDGTANFTLANAATIDLRGVWTNSSLERDEPDQAAYVDGGSLDVRMTHGSVVVESGTTIDVTSGATLTSKGRLIGGRGGSVSLVAGADIVEGVSDSIPASAKLVLDGTIRAEGVVGGGTLTLRAPQAVTFGGNAILASGVLPPGVPLPASVQLTEGFVLPAGTVMTFAATRTLDVFAPGAPIPMGARPLNGVPTILADSWTVPVGVGGTANGNTPLVAGRVMPAGTSVVLYSMPGGYVLPASAFPNGLPAQPYTATLMPGDRLLKAVRFEAGEILPQGAVLTQAISFKPALTLDPAILATGFSNYSIASLGGIAIGDGVALRPIVPTLRLSEGSAAAASGTDPARALESWQPSVYLDSPNDAVITQRPGASIALAGASMALGRGAVIEVDPLQSISLTTNQATVDGSLIAHGGRIALLPDLQRRFLIGSLWIGGDAVLDVSGEAVTARDSRGFRYGLVQDGGSLLIGLADATPASNGYLAATASPVVIRPGARLLANGASAIIDADRADGPDFSRSATLVGGDGGLIRIGSLASILLDGTLQARAGSLQAAGGTLNIALENSTLADQASVLRTITLAQEHVGSGLPSDATATSMGRLPVGVARLSAADITAGGFGTLDLWARDVLAFGSDVSLQMSEALLIHRGVFTVAAAAGAPDIRLSAPYLLLDGKTPNLVDGGAIPPGLGLNDYLGDFAATNVGHLTLTADLVDVRNSVQFGMVGRVFTLSASETVEVPGFAHVAVNSSGDVRFTNGELISNGPDLTITASQLYPTTGATGNVRVGPLRSPLPGDPDWTLTIRGLGDAPAVPLSVFGSLTLTAPTIDQGGIVRAPLGLITFGVVPRSFGTTAQYLSEVSLKPGSITSVSADGLTMPYGGTSDGLAYLYNGHSVAFVDLADFNSNNNFVETTINRGIVFGQATLTADQGARLDASGGGRLTGAGFFTGRGGSIDVLRTALANANPANIFSSSGAQVYALVPGAAAAGYAPVTPDVSAPAIGQQVTLDRAVGDLPAGTYTLMPATYALLPGAYRIELGAETSIGVNVTRLENGSYRASGYLGTANTAVRDALPTVLTITPAATVRTYSQYNETSYADFAIANANLFGAVRPRLERDASAIHFDFGPATGQVLDFRGVADLAPAAGGRSGTLFVSSRANIEVRAISSDAAAAGYASIVADDLNRFNAGALVIGGLYSLVQALDGAGVALGPQVAFLSAGNDTVVRSGAVISAGQVFLVGQSVRVEGGGVVDTRAGSNDVIDSALGYVFAAGSGAVLGVGNGRLDFLGPTGGSNQPANTIVVGDGASLLTQGTISLSSSGAPQLGDVNLAARYVALAASTFDVGTDADIVAGGGSGVRLTQHLIDRLLTSATPVERVTLAGGSSINLFGNATLNLLGQVGATPTLVLNTPAIYGWGASTDRATISADTVVWNGLATGVGSASSPYVSVAPGAVAPGGAGTGSGNLTISASHIEFGYGPGTRPQTQTALDRLALGFTTVDLVASDRITANSRGTLSVYASGTSSQTYAGGDLNMLTPLLTGEAGSAMSYTAGGRITLTAPASGATNTAAVAALGAEIKLNGASVMIDTAVALPSGRFAITAAQSIVLDQHAVVDLSGRAVQFFDVTKYSWGGDLVMEVTDGAIVQRPNALIDVSATHANAGTIKATATGASGLVDLRGRLLGQGGDGFVAGGFDVRVTSLPDFAGLNASLNAGGFFDARSFVIKTGDLVIGNEVRANRISVSLDGGALTIDGRLDASGASVGTISLAARDDLILTNNAVLDAHGSSVVRDGRGVAIDASNRAVVELTSVAGVVRIGSGSIIDLRAGDGVARGQLEINAPRVGSDDVGIDAAAGLTVRGAASISLNAFTSYMPSGGIIDQGLLDLIHGDSTAFMAAAGGNAALAARLTGLSNYGDAFRLRPGVEIRSATSDGNLIITGDLDLSGYRYGNITTGVRGSGDAGTLVIRAGGSLTVNGSINDGFAPPSVTPDDGNWYTPNTVVRPGLAATADVTFTPPFDPNYFDNVYVFPSANEFNNPDWPVVVSGSITDSTRTYYQGDVIEFGVLYGQITITQGTTLSARNPANATITQREPRAGSNWAVAPMLDPGMQSWSIRLVSGADLGSASSRTLSAASALHGRGDMVLDAPGLAGPEMASPLIAVIRTGTGSLELLAGSDFKQQSLFGIYTAGTSVAGTDAYNLDRAPSSDGTVLGAGNSAYEDTLNPQRMYFADHGGDLTLTTQGELRGFTSYGNSSSSGEIGNWLWLQGNASRGETAAWGINFGQYRFDGALNYGSGGVTMSGFAGIGTLGGGNVRVTAGGDAGSTTNFNLLADPALTSNQSFSVVVGSSGYVTADGNLVQFGGGALRLDVGGWINTGLSNDTELATGSVVNLRGDTRVTAGSIGQVGETGYGVVAAGDPRAPDVTRPRDRVVFSPLGLAVGDGAISLTTRGDLGLLTATDPGRQTPLGSGTATNDAGDPTLGSNTAFSLWTDRSGYTVFSGGGDIVQVPRTLSSTTTAFRLYDPGQFTAIAPAGSITTQIVLAPSRAGTLELFAGGSLFGQASMSSGAASSLAMPFQPLWVEGDLAWASSPAATTSNGFQITNVWGGTVGFSLFAFAFDAATNLHADASDPIRAYARGDVMMQIGSVIQTDPYSNPDLFTLVAAKPVDMRAGRDVLASGFILNTSPNDISNVAAGRDLLNTTLKIWGPGLLQVSAGRNIYQALGSKIVRIDQLDSTINSYGPIVSGDRQPGAGILLTAGAGPQGPSYADFAARYLDPRNLADPALPLLSSANAGKVVKTYDAELQVWLRERFGYQGSAADALAYFWALPIDQQNVFVRMVYFDELKAGGREYTDPTGPRSGSYVRGRAAIAALFPAQATGAGSVTLLNSAGIHTERGGDVQVLAPAGGLTLGVEGVVPPSTTGLLTQGAGDIQVFTRDSVLLGLSRVFTTFGGDILVWSEVGDINAGRGAKTSLVFTPPLRVYDDYGNVTLSPQTPSSGAGIATLSPIPQVPAGDIDLIAPLGTIDAGEAGIRASGNINLAALQIVNAANINVQGTATGLPTVQAPNMTAGLASTNATSATQQSAAPTSAGNEPRSVIIVEFLGFGGGDRDGDDDKERRRSQTKPDERATQDPSSPVQVIGAGSLDQAAMERLRPEERQRLVR
ncbi:filamentous haemagglutinin family protein [Rhodopseudomonas palustris]|nr:filamentous haemagglutinin family protein [Rhodopseudomonas palustris]